MTKPAVRTRAAAALLLVSLFLLHGTASAQSADLTVSIDNERGYVSPAQNIAYTVSVRNNGPDAVTGATIADAFPAALTSVTWQAAPDGSATSTTGAGTGNLNDTMNLPAGAAIVYTVQASVSQTASGTITNTVTVTVPDGTTDLSPANNTATDTDPVVAQEISRIRPVYANGLPSPNVFAASGDTPPDNGAAAFGGHVGDWSAPVDPDRSQPRFVLKASSIGQPLAQFRSQCIDANTVIDDAMAALFYPVSKNGRAAFRYLDTLYTKSPGKSGAVEEIERRLDGYLLYDATVDPTDGKESDEELALKKAKEVIEALQAEPDNRDLRNLLLDIYYYRALGRQIAAKDLVAKAYQVNFSTVVALDASFGTPINVEIDAYKEATETLEAVLDPYRDLLLNDFGIDVKEIDSAYQGNVPFGYYLFQQEVPYRSVYAPTYSNYDPNTGDVSGDVEAPPSREAPVMTVSPVSFQAPAAGGQFSFTISNAGAGTDGAGNLEWQATTTDNTMLSITATGISPLPPLPAVNTTTVTFTVAANTTSSLVRTGKIHVADKSGSADAFSYDVIVVQEGVSGPILDVSPKHIYVSAIDFLSNPSDIIYKLVPIYIQNAGVGNLKWTANVSDFWTSPSNQSPRRLLNFQSPVNPLDLYEQTMSGTNNGMLMLVIWVEAIGDALYELNRRSIPFESTVAITNTDTNVSTSVKVHYTGWGNWNPTAKAAEVPRLGVYPDTVEVGSAATDREVLVENVTLVGPLTVTSGASWLKASEPDPESGLTTLSIAQNTSAQRRTGMITVSAPNAVPSTATISVVQDGTSQAGLSVSPSRRYVDHFEGQAKPSPDGTGFTVAPVGNGNIRWTARITKGGDWLRIASGGSGTNAGEILFSYDANYRVAGRTAEIQITSPDAVASQNTVTVQVTQRGSTGTPVLAGGFKDLALLFDVMRDDAQVNKELARRYALRRLQGDVDTAYDLIAKTVTKHTAALNDLGGIIPDWQKRVSVNSDLVSSYMSWQQAIAELDSVRDFLDGDTNILGFQENFLFLVQAFEGQDTELFDSYNKLLAYMFDDANNVIVPTSPLGQAYQKYLTARDEYDKYVETQDTLKEELRTQNLEHRKWMYDVVGCDPGNDPDNPTDPVSYNNPSANYGGELWMIDRNIERAKEAVRQNEAELKSVVNQINTEVWRHAQESQINATIQDVYVKYGDQLATLDLVLGGISAVQSSTAAFADAVGSFAEGKAGTGVAKLYNSAVQLAAETAKGAVNAQKTKLTALQTAVVTGLQADILDVNSKALLANLTNQAALVGMQSADLNLALIQEIASKQANLDEWHYREAQMRENNAALLGRSFANPVYRLRMKKSMLEAESSFKVAQRWLFFTIRALEYKWNAPFSFSNDSGDWSMDSLFRARTGKDLVDLIAAIRDFDGLMEGGSRGDDRFDWFSFKEDFFGLIPVYEKDGVTEKRAYSHPSTGYAATATEVFQAKVKAALDEDTGIITLPFSTVKDNGISFFRGPRRDPKNPENVITAGQYLDKIEWLKVNLLGDFDGGAYDRVGGALTYSGSGYVRNARVGTIPDISRPDVIVDEFTLWPTKCWFYDSGQPWTTPPVPAAWRSSSEQTTDIVLNLTDVSRYEVPETVSEINVFRERSVACDGWKLRIFTKQNGVTAVHVEQMNDIEILFYHYSKDRPNLAKSDEAGK